MWQYASDYLDSYIDCITSCPGQSGCSQWPGLGWGACTPGPSGSSQGPGWGGIIFCKNGAKTLNNKKRTQYKTYFLINSVFKILYLT